MGYTHYWKIKKELPKEQWEAFKDETCALLDDPSVSDIIGDAMGNAGFPRITDTEVTFNGVGKKAHETFSIDRCAGHREYCKPIFNFCKTAYKPYDRYVVRVLLLAEKHFGDSISVSSDGNWEEIRNQNQNQTKETNE